MIKGQNHMLPSLRQIHSRVDQSFLCKNLANQEVFLSALEGLAAVVNCVTCSAPVSGSTLYVHACHPRGALPAPGLTGCPMSRGE